MAELTQSVVVCNLDGQVLLYNNRRGCSSAPWPEPRIWPRAPAAIGLGRSIYTVFDRPLVDHALDTIRQRMARGVAQPVGAVRHHDPRRPAAARADGRGAGHSPGRCWAASC
jgi:hypothetical protein